jgi:raffinose/stachyose/melibiose transport system substrate-binding protein
MKHMNARAFKALVAMTFAISATVVPISQSLAAGESLGKSCPTAGVSTGTKSTSLICVKSADGKQTWQRVKLAAGSGRPVANLTPPKGEIEFWHYRPEDKALFQTIIDNFQAAYPGTKVTQVIKTTTDYNATARVQILANPKAALSLQQPAALFSMTSSTAVSHLISPTNGSLTRIWLQKVLLQER